MKTEGQLKMYLYLNLFLKSVKTNLPGANDSLSDYRSIPTSIAIRHNLYITVKKKQKKHKYSAHEK